MEQFIEDLLNDPDTSEFGKYFQQNYAQRPEKWAYCYRKGLGINTNMYFESLHKKIKYHYFDGKHVKRLDVAIDGLLKLSVSNEFKPLISGTTDGAEAWKILREHFEPTTRARIIQLLDEFCGTRYVPGENLGLFICRVKRSAERLREVGHDLPALYQVYQMIRSLPDDFRSTVQPMCDKSIRNFITNLLSRPF
ncbi:uncharacterized protein TNCV_3192881 [Trichonephila clavipes]|nr:uncharacterized protein TNCV_3192881 [Trichonephila clavipes]